MSSRPQRCRNTDRGCGDQDERSPPTAAFLAV